MSDLTRDDLVGKWLSAALDDPDVCNEMKADIRKWMDTAPDAPSARAGALEEAARVCERMAEPSDAEGYTEPDTNAFIWTNKEAEWASIKLEDAATAIRALPRAEAAPEQVLDFDAESWKAIKDAASKSPWIPKEYYLNDWVSDVCAFLLKPEEYQDTVPASPKHDDTTVTRRCPTCGYPNGRHHMHCK